MSVEQEEALAPPAPSRAVVRRRRPRSPLIIYLNARPPERIVEQ
jgi:hypothetical protein